MSISIGKLELVGFKCFGCKFCGLKLLDLCLIPGFNFNPTSNSYNFYILIHSIGRTGRVGNRGKATSFFDPDQDQNLVSDLVRILTQTKQPIPDFFSGVSTGSFGMADKYGGSDIRQSIAAGKPQQNEEDW